MNNLEEIMPTLSRKVRQNHSLSSQTTDSEEDVSESESEEENQPLPFQFQNGFHPEMRIPFETHVIFHQNFPPLSTTKPCDMSLGEYFKYKYANAVHRRRDQVEAFQISTLLMSQSPEEFDLKEREKGHARFLEIRERADALQAEWTQEIREMQFLSPNPVSTSETSLASSSGSNGSGYVKVRTPLRLDETEESFLPPLPLARKLREEISNEEKAEKVELGVEMKEKKKIRCFLHFHQNKPKGEEGQSTTPTDPSKGLGSEKKGFLCWKKILQAFNSLR